jgi:hypothetical protein
MSPFSRKKVYGDESHQLKLEDRIGFYQPPKYYTTPPENLYSSQLPISDKQRLSETLRAEYG